jgi:hypothetical protein
MCIGRSTREATASAGYEAFVKQPSGVIERELGPFAPGAFRLDVSADIGDGESWQLGVFVAHALAAEGRLAEYHEDADAALWLTGEVANDLEVRPVGHVPDKLRAARAELDALAADGTPATLIVPAANRDYLDHAELPPAVARIAVSRTDDALAAAGLPLRASRAGDDGDTRVILAPPPRGQTRARRRRWVYPALALLILAAAAASYPFAQRFLASDSSGVATKPMPSVSTQVEVRPSATETATPRAAPAAPPRPEIGFVIRERRAPAGATCAAVHLRRVTAEMVDVRRAAPGRFSASRHDGLCGLQFVVRNSGAPAYVAAFTTMVSGGFVDAGPAPDMVRGASPFEGETSWAVDVARRLDGPIDYRLIVLVSDRPVTAAAARLRADADPVAAADRLAPTVTVHHARHRVDP